MIAHATHEPHPCTPNWKGYLYAASHRVDGASVVLEYTARLRVYRSENDVRHIE
ncbi:MAG: hypothetical protein ABI324_11225 [Ktedonobacteraceae bacterium]